MSEALVQLRRAERRFGARVALAELDLSVPPRSILGLAGPNGSGKTTLLRLLAGLLAPSSGEVRVFGLDPRTEREQVMREARFAFAPPPLYPRLTAREHVTRLAAIGAKRPTPRDVDRVLDLVGLSDRSEDRVRGFSFGMRQRLVLAQAMLPRPRLLVLDEPTDGLDPLAVLELRELLQRLRTEEGLTLILASHLLLELDQLVDDLLVLDGGKVLYHGRPDELRSSKGTYHLRATHPHDAVQALRADGLSVEIGSGDSTSPGTGEHSRPPVLLIASESLSLARVTSILSATSCTVEEFALVRPTLESALLARLRAHRAGAGQHPSAGAAQHPSAGAAQHPSGGARQS